MTKPPRTDRSDRSDPSDYRRGMRSRQLSASLLAGLLQKGLRPGERLPTEQELTRQFAVSRPTLRQALKTLEFAGIIDSVPRRGTVLKHADVRALAPLFAAHLSLGRGADRPQGDLADLLEARWVLERAVLPLAAARRQAADLAALQAADGRFEDALRRGDEPRRLAADGEFHRACIVAAHNDVLDALATLVEAYFAMVAQLPRPRPATLRSQTQTLAEHADIRKALEAGDGTGACAVLDRHLAHVEPTSPRRNQ